jgi:hypothetical protein
MLKIALLSSLLLSHALAAADWISKDKAFGFTLADKWAEQAQNDPAVEAQFTSADGTRALNITVSPVPANYRFARKTVDAFVAKQGGTVLGFADQAEQGDTTVRYSMDLPGTGQVSVVMKFSNGKCYKWQAMTAGKLADDAELGAMAKSVHLIK